MKIVVTGARGFIATKLIERLVSSGHQVVPLSRSGREVGWNPDSGKVWGNPFDDADGVINLAGESILGLWTSEKKRRVLESRVHSTRLVVEEMARRRVKLLINASATGYYGDRGNEPLTENSRAGDGFMAEVCEVWEQEALEARSFGARVVCLRMGVVLHGSGGLVPRISLFPKLRLLPIPGDGKNFLPWIHLEDVLDAVEFLLKNPLEGSVNLVSPGRVRAEEFYRALSDTVAGRFRVTFRIPRAFVTFFSGDLGRELLLSSQMVIPTKLESAGFDFRFQDIKSAFGDIFSKREG